MSAEFHPAVARWFARTFAAPTPAQRAAWPVDRKSTRLNSSHSQISYAVFCLKKKNQIAIKKSLAVTYLENIVAHLSRVRNDWFFTKVLRGFTIAKNIRCTSS